ncbi:cyclodeaminase/cyclohydrolase family protein [Nocardioides lianchengensis]|uniref:cyclodeaminase/cyclohydrolase family protein n=1 Tax=Nocardioides lianchengensis TaxID=1045774 RepID=UPI001481C945|nr:cyclodeaminase/cyclohydrolase family protein [Nocardioides lianchengensis]NYG08816.1 formiminotetrahydrofolate cyclodeaminase [Nocardioides lianchengensis]
MEPLDAWLDRLAAPGADPGGGAAAAVMLGLGSALVGKVASYPSRDGADLAGVRDAADALRRRSLKLVAADGAASARLVAAWRSRSDDLAAAAVAAAGTSADILAVVEDAIPLLAELARLGSAPLLADVAAAAAAYGAAARVAVLNLDGDLHLAGAPDREDLAGRGERLIARLDAATRIPR